MKPEKKPFVVEIKNRRRLSRKEHSIWGKIDLKAAGDQVDAEQTAGESDLAMSMRPSEAATDQNATDISA
ncbi:hypothetical protein ABIE78_000048 [Sinorhizobium fredii]|uniref:hypothetical protein n=1 Tax=Sinorhizobium TaxID=28105 RepID=UPI0004B6131A|nr:MULTISPECIES: hypothetical protein [Sinorhizobium]KSV90136.1 hypothetical protein N181_13110 [Sinorhizobium fredii USDA 205]GEC31553.1 hypothetical protein EFR01_17240 [Sinorhizobium fredii]GLS07142.1 hypothetical protein GCM10007864_07680 [Sinorhizobium fredii]